MKKNLVIVILCCLIQQLQAQIVGGKTYRIESVASSGKSFFVKNSSQDNAADVVLWTDTNVPSQQWTAILNDDGSFTFQNVYSGLYLTRKGIVTSSSLVNQTTLGTLSSAKWVVGAVPGLTDQYQLIQTNATSSYCLTVLGSTDGSNIGLSTTQADGSSTQQLWKFVEVDPITQLTTSVREQVMNGWTAQFLRPHDVNYSFGDGGGWGDAEMLETMLDAYETSGKKEYLDIFTKAFNYFRLNVGDDWLKLVYNSSYKWFGQDFNDDVMWMIIASARAAKLTGITTYSNLAKRNFDAIYNRALNQWGMLRWAEQSGNVNGTNACINGPAEVAACYIAMITGDESYFDKARKLYANQRRYLFNAATGKVYDSFTWDASTNQPSSYNYWSSTYNQGTMLGAAVMLYKHYGDEMYKQDADRLIDFSVKNLCDANGIISVCQVVDGDLCGFKGILMRYVRKYIIDMNKPSYVSWMQKNAMRAFSNMNSKNIISSAWLTKSNEDFTFGDKTFNKQPFGCSTAVSAMFNAPLDANRIIKSAYEPIRADEFNYLMGVYLNSSTSGFGNYEISNVRNGYTVGYHWVDFGTRPATSVSFDVSELGSSGYQCAIEVHLDSINGPTIGVASIPNTAGWKTVTTSIAPTDGLHHIYLKFINKTNSFAVNSFSLAGMRFGSDQLALSGDITDNGGQMTASQSVAYLANLSDNHLTSMTTVDNFTGQASFEYNAQTPVFLKGYAIGSGWDDPSTDPKNWMLQGSNDRVSWTTLDTQEAQTFNSRCLNKGIAVQSNTAYQYFRLLVTGNNGADKLCLSEWQLFGTNIFAHDITADGGTTQPEYTALIDKNETTTAMTQSGTAITVNYQAKGRYVLSSYSLTGMNANAAENPSSWKLLGSVDGTNWTIVDSRTNEDFRFDRSTQFYQVNTQAAYSYFRLQVNGNHGGANTAFSELQLFGSLQADRIFYNDITKNGGQITASNGAEGAALDPLIDNDAATVSTLPFNGEAWVQYQTPIPATVKGYSICIGYDDAKNPRVWALQGSNDGTTWTLLHQGSVYTAIAKGTVRTYSITNSSKYTYYRLLVKQLSNSSSTEVVLGEFELHGLAVAPQDLTVSNGYKTALIPGKISAEVADMAFDKSEATKYCFSFYGSCWLNYQAPTAIKCNLYSITTANDDAARDPQDWKLLGSNDGYTWKVLDERTNQSFYDRMTTQYYSFNNSESFTQYRLQIETNHGSDLGQLSEWQLFYSDAIATDVKDIQLEDFDIKAYPNPVVDLLNIVLPANGLVQVFDSQGQLVKRQSAQKGTSQLSFAELKRGLYLVKVNCDSRSKTIKIVK